MSKTNLFIANPESDLWVFQHWLPWLTQKRGIFRLTETISKCYIIIKPEQTFSLPLPQIQFSLFSFINPQIPSIFLFSLGFVWTCLRANKWSVNKFVQRRPWKPALPTMVHTPTKPGTHCSNCFPLDKNRILFRSITRQKQTGFWHSHRELCATRKPNGNCLIDSHMKWFQSQGGAEKNLWSLLS